MYPQHNFQSQLLRVPFSFFVQKVQVSTYFWLAFSYNLLYTVIQGLDFICYEPNIANVISFCHVISYSVRKHNLKLAYVQKHSEMEAFFWAEKVKYL